MPRRKLLSRKSDPSFPQWRAFLDHPGTRTAAFVLPFLALCFTGWSAFTAAQNFAGAQRLSSYQLLSSESAGVPAKIRAMESLLAAGETIYGVNATCPAATYCGQADALKAKGRIAYSNFSGVTFFEAEFSDFAFDHLKAQNAVFALSILRDGRFESSDLTGAAFEGTKLIDVDFEGTLASANIAGAALENVSFWGVEVSDMTVCAARFRPRLGRDPGPAFACANDLDLSGAWFRHGHPPRGTEHLPPGNYGYAYSCPEDFNGGEGKFSPFEQCQSVRIGELSAPDIILPPCPENATGDDRLFCDSDLKQPTP